MLQETFMKLHAQLDAGVNIAHPRAWLFQVGTNLSKDEKRNEIRAAVREERYSAQPTVIEFHAQLEKRQVIRRTLDQLSPRMRQVLLLFSEGFTYREISEISGVEATYVGVLLQRARAAFKKHYQRGNATKATAQVCVHPANANHSIVGLPFVAFHPRATLSLVLGDQGLC
ncbi:MAG TPA: RNA polymerase sigma factor [Pyrinomonadaceae bacterium]